MELKYLNKYPNFKTIVEQILNLVMKKLKILKFHKNLGKSYFDKAEEFSINFKKYLENEKIDLKVPVKAYLKMCAELRLKLMLQLHLQKTIKKMLLKLEAEENYN